MKTWKLVSGILSIILSVLVILQSCAAGFANTIADNGEASGTGGLLVAVLLLAGGIVSIATKKGSKGGNIALIILFGIGALIAFATAGTLYKDLYVWGGWCSICGILAIVSLTKKQPEPAYDTGAMNASRYPQNPTLRNANRNAYQQPGYQNPYPQDAGYMDPYPQAPYNGQQGYPDPYQSNTGYGNPYGQANYQDPYAPYPNQDYADPYRQENTGMYNPDPYAQYPYEQPIPQDPSPYDPYFDPRYDRPKEEQGTASYDSDFDPYDRFH